MVTLSPSAAPTRITSFPLESPSVWVRRKEDGGGSRILPYFIAGEENRLAAFVAAADPDTLAVGNPLLLIGASGVGKSVLALHLAARLAHAPEHDRDAPLGAVLYLNAVDFARCYAQAVAADDLQTLRDQLHRSAVLIIDDLHLIADKEAAQDELALRLEHRTEREQPTILTSARLPSEIPGMRPLLASRTLPGLTIPLSIPSGEARLQILRELAVHHSLELEETLLRSLHQRLDQRISVRSMEAAIKQICLWSRMHQQPPSVEALDHVVATIGGNEEVSLAEITAIVAKYFRLRRSDLRSGSRKQSLVRARSLAMLLGRRLTSKSMHQIGDYFGGRDHTTVLHAIRKTEALLEKEPDWRHAAEEIQEKLAAR